MSRKPLSALEDHAGFWLRLVSNHVSHAFARKLLEAGVGVAEWVFLREMYGRDDLTPGELAERTGLTRGAASKLIDRLVAKQLAAREERAGDRRYQDLKLTAAGRRIVPVLAALADANDSEVFGALNPAERAGLIAVLKKLAKGSGLHQIPIE